ncbi:IS3 family transposase [Noviherbaspirillum sedimenti]|uniref:IS3 family transposase n=1 Tax=Noviherbaspirillum sedimenti TaxID=2320865 RepID=A0A3A3G478_9BURK|nr:IS3 family transposase [Noviherbaspirillum sedimenti]RJG03278.1 IS3 family transposase [Noviherbaspirillum sedimenti]
MSKSRSPYPAELRKQLVELVHAGRTPTELSREFKVTAQSIANWVGQAAIDAGKPLPGKDGLASTEREELARLRRQLKQLQAERDILVKANGLVRGSQRCDIPEVFALVMANQAVLPVRTMCRVLGISASGYYAWRDRRPSARAVANAVVTERIRQIHADSDLAYGMPRVRGKLMDQGMVISRQRVAVLMRKAGIRGISRRRGMPVPIGHEECHRAAQDHLVADAPNQLWVADMKYIPTRVGFIYLAVVIDAFSGRVVGWAIGEHVASDLVLSALNVAQEQSRATGGIHHGDQGSQYASVALGNRCRSMGVRPSVGTVDGSSDKAMTMTESFFARLERDLLDWRMFKTKIDASLAISTWIESWYNPRHSGLQETLTVA